MTTMRDAVAECGPIEVVPVITGKDWTEPAPSVGRARTLAEARRMLRDAGYRIMAVGGVIEVEWRDGEEPTLLVTVYPTRR